MGWMNLRLFLLYYVWSPIVLWANHRKSFIQHSDRTILVEHLIWRRYSAHIWLFWVQGVERAHCWNCRFPLDSDCSTGCPQLEPTAGALLSHLHWRISFCPFAGIGHLLGSFWKGDVKGPKYFLHGFWPRPTLSVHSSPLEIQISTSSAAVWTVAHSLSAKQFTTPPGCIALGINEIFQNH